MGRRIQHSQSLNFYNFEKLIWMKVITGTCARGWHQTAVLPPWSWISFQHHWKLTVTCGVFVNVSESQFLHLQNGDKNTCLTALPEGLKTMFIKCFEQKLASYLLASLHIIIPIVIFVIGASTLLRGPSLVFGTVSPRCLWQRRFQW